MLSFRCDPPWCAPEGPGNPWGTAELGVWDSVRVVLVLISAFVAIRSVIAAVWTDNRGQTWRYVALSMFAVITAGTELNHLGDWAHWRLPLSAVGVTAAAIGIRGADRDREREQRT